MFIGKVEGMFHVQWGQGLTDKKSSTYYSKPNVTYGRCKFHTYDSGGIWILERWIGLLSSSDSAAYSRRVPIFGNEKWKWSRSVVSDSCNPMDCSLPARLFQKWIFQARITGVGCHFLGIFPTQGSNPGLLHCRQTPYHLNHQGSGIFGRMEAISGSLVCMLNVSTIVVPWETDIKF